MTSARKAPIILCQTFLKHPGLWMHARRYAGEGGASPFVLLLKDAIDDVVAQEVFDPEIRKCHLSAFVPHLGHEVEQGGSGLATRGGGEADTKRVSGIAKDLPRLAAALLNKPATTVSVRTAPNGRPPWLRAKSGRLPMAVSAATICDGRSKRGNRGPIPLGA